MRTFFPALETIFLVVILTSAAAANEAKPPEVKLAAAFQLPQIPGLSGALGGLAPVGFVFHLYCKTIRPGSKRRVERLVGRSVSGLAL